MAEQIKARMAQKIDTEANWNTATNFKPLKGEIIVYSPSGTTKTRIKIGDGTTKIGDLPFLETVFYTLAEIGISDATNLATVCDAMPIKSMLIISGSEAVNKIGDLGRISAAAGSGPYVFIKIDENSGLSIIHTIYKKNDSNLYSGLDSAFYYRADNTIQWTYGEMHSTNQNSQECRWRYTLDGEEQWINPPMAIGAEYRTTEHWNSKPVYTKLINFGELPNSTTKSVSHGANATNCLRIAGTRTDGEMLPLHFQEKNIVMYFSPTKVYVTANYDATGKSAYIQLWYTKD